MLPDMLELHWENAVTQSRKANEIKVFLNFRLLKVHQNVIEGSGGYSVNVSAA